MTQTVIGLLGISGVGKSTFLRKIANLLDFQHLQASVLIRDGRQTTQSKTLAVDNLREANIDENQNFLTTGFLQAVDRNAKIVILDGHSVIDTPSGLIPIEASIFTKLAIEKIIFLFDEPAEILCRRVNDGNRNRPSRSLDELRKYQDAAILSGSKICLALGIPMILVSPSQQDYILGVLSNPPT